MRLSAPGFVFALMSVFVAGTVGPANGQDLEENLYYEGGVKSQEELQRGALLTRIWLGERKEASVSNDTTLATIGSEAVSEPAESASDTAPRLIVIKPFRAPHASLSVLTNGVAVAGSQLMRGSAAEVVYTADGGFLFEDGSPVLTNAMDTTGVAAINRSGEKPPVAGRPFIQLGAARQRYPWNGELDIEYRTRFWPRGLSAAIEVQVGDRFYTNAFEVAGSGVVSGTTFLDMRKLVPCINGRVNFKAFPNPVTPAVDGSDRTQGDPRE